MRAVGLPLRAAGALRPAFADTGALLSRRCLFSSLQSRVPLGDVLPPPFLTDERAFLVNSAQALVHHQPEQRGDSTVDPVFLNFFESDEWKCFEDVGDASVVLEMPPSDLDAWLEEQVILEMQKRTYQPSTTRRRRRHGFLNRLRSTTGSKILQRRRAKNRKRLGVS